VKKEGSGKVVKFDLLSLFAGRESCVKRSGHAMFHNTPVKAGIFLDILNLRSFDKSPSGGFPTVVSIILLYDSQHRSLIAIGHNLLLTLW
jgi:hypothetical protein